MYTQVSNQWAGPWTPSRLQSVQSARTLLSSERVWWRETRVLVASVDSELLLLNFPHEKIKAALKFMN